MPETIERNYRVLPIEPEQWLVVVYRGLDHVPRQPNVKFFDSQELAIEAGRIAYREENVVHVYIARVHKSFHNKT